MGMRDHILFGSARFNTLATGCGKKPVLHVNKTVDGKRTGADYYTHGLGIALPEAQFVESLTAHPHHCCKTCIAKLRAVYRDRGDRWPFVSRLPTDSDPQERT